MDHKPAHLILPMPEDTERTSTEDVLQSSELAARLLRRLIASPGVIDTQRVFKTYTRLTEMITHAHPLLHDLLTRYCIDDDSALQNLPLVMDPPWMLNLNTYLTNNNSSSSSTINNSFFAHNNTNQFISTASTSSTTHTELHDATSQPSPPETFRVSRSRTGRRQSVPVNASETLIRAPLVPPVIQRELPKTEMKTLRLPQKDTALAQKPGSVLGQGQYRNAVVSGESRDSNNYSVIDAQRRPDATALRYRPLPTVTLEAAPKDTLRIKNDRHSVTERSIEVRQGSNTTRTLFEKTDTAAPAQTTPPTLPLVQEQLPPTQFQTRPQQLVLRKSADSLTLRDLVSDLSSSGPLASVRQALDSLPMAQAPQSAQTIKPESSSRADEQSTSEEITTDDMLRRISKMLLIERERRGY